MSIKRPQDPVEFHSSRVFNSCQSIVDWFNAQVEKKRVRIPVYIELSSQSFAPYKTIFLGTEPIVGMEIKLDDSRMGICFADRLQMESPDSDEYCQLWIEGYWGISLLFPSSDEGHGFTVVDISGVIPEDKRSELRVSWS